MPLNASNSSSPTLKVFARQVAPFAPLALALLMNAVPPSKTAPEKAVGEPSATGITAVKCGEEVADSQDCHSRYPTGCNADGQYDAYLNFWKDQLIDPATASNPAKYYTDLADYKKLDASIPSGLTTNNQGDFQEQLKRLGEGQQYGIVGYLYYSQSTSAESSNCDLTGPPGNPNFGNVDYHIGIGFDPAVAQQLRSERAARTEASTAPTAGGKSPTKSPTSSGPGASLLQQNSIIVEMTPHDRFRYENDVWTLDNLKRATGRQVKVVGQLIIDNEHNLPSQNCATAQPGADKQTCWRASVWELHPVVRFQVCPKDSCAVDATDWMELDQLQ